MFIKQDPMRRVLWALAPIGLWSVWLYGWRVLVLAALVFLLGVLTEFVFERSRDKKVSEAVLVSCALFSLSLPPAVPLWVAAVGIVFAVLFGKEVFGGFGRNIFNPAIGGRMFIYVSFPLLMQTTWMLPGWFGSGGMNRQALGSTWTEALFMLGLAAALFIALTRRPAGTRFTVGAILLAVALATAFYVAGSYLGFRSAATIELDAVASATPLEISKGLAAGWQPKPGYEWLAANGLDKLFLGLRAGSIGEGAIFLILLAAVYLMATRTAQWRLILSSFGSAALLAGILYWSGAMKGHLLLMDPAGKDLSAQLSQFLGFLMSGSLLFVVVFMATDPISAPKKAAGQLIYGCIIGGVTILVRCFTGFPEGTSFAVLCANTFAPLIDELLPARKPTAASRQQAGSAQPEAKP